jgi:hypothetical protein
MSNTLKTLLAALGLSLLACAIGRWNRSRSIRESRRLQKRLDRFKQRPFQHNYLDTKPKTTTAFLKAVRREPWRP